MTEGKKNSNLIYLQEYEEKTSERQKSNHIKLL